MPHTVLLLGLLISLALPSSAQKVDPALEYESLFHRQSGWTGADGTYSYPLGNGRIVWGFSDTFFGDIVAGARREPFRFVNNSMVVQDSSGLKFLDAPVFTPPDRRGWFWLFDAASSGDSSGEILLGQFEGHGDGGFGFRQCGLWVARFSVAPGAARVAVSDYRKLPFFTEGTTFGPAILETPSWLYLYGVRDKGLERSSILARVPRGSLSDPGTWRFYDGTGWSRGMEAAVPLFANASMEASVYRTRSGSYLYVGSDHATAEVVARVAPSPEGPWSDAVGMLKPPEHGGDIFTYNAKAHPELSRDGRVLISYNVNTYDLGKAVSDADIYRPRFFWWTPPQDAWLP